MKADGQLRALLLQEGSKQLLRETAEAERAGLNFGGVRDLRPLLDADDGGGMLHPFLLHAVAATLDAAAALHQHIEQLAAVSPREQLGAGPECQTFVLGCVPQTCLICGDYSWRCMCLALTFSHRDAHEVSRLPCAAAHAHANGQSCGARQALQGRLHLT